MLSLLTENLEREPVYLSTAWLCLCDSVSVPLTLRAAHIHVVGHPTARRQFCQLYYDSDAIFEASGKGCDIRGLIKAWVWERLGLVDSQSHTETNQWNLLPYDTVPSCCRVQAQWPCKAAKIAQGVCPDLEAGGGGFLQKMRWLD